MLEEEFTENTLEKTTYFKKKDCCVCINVFAECDKNHPWKEKDSYKDKKEDCCVCINVFAECDKKYPWEEKDYCKEKKDECCVCINVYTECED